MCMVWFHFYNIYTQIQLSSADYSTYMTEQQTIVRKLLTKSKRMVASEKMNEGKEGVDMRELLECQECLKFYLNCSYKRVYFIVML